MQLNETKNKVDELARNLATTENERNDESNKRLEIEKELLALKESLKKFETEMKLSKESYEKLLKDNNGNINFFFFFLSFFRSLSLYLDHKLR